MDLRKARLRTEPSGAIAVAATLSGTLQLDGDGDVVIVISGRNVDDASFGTGSAIYRTAGGFISRGCSNTRNVRMPLRVLIAPLSIE